MHKEACRGENRCGRLFRSVCGRRLFESTSRNLYDFVIY